MPRVTPRKNVIVLRRSKWEEILVIEKGGTGWLIDLRTCVNETKYPMDVITHPLPKATLELVGNVLGYYADCL